MLSLNEETAALRIFQTIYGYPSLAQRPYIDFIPDAAVSLFVIV